MRPREDDEEEEEEEEEEAPLPVRKGRTKAAAKRTVAGRSAPGDTQDGVVSSFDNPPNPKYVSSLSVWSTRTDWLRSFQEEPR